MLLIKKMTILNICITIIIIIFTCKTFAFDGYSGFNAGVSSGGEKDKLNYEYQEICFVGGTPLLLKGSLNIKKSESKGIVTSTYTYKLSNNDNTSILSRKYIYTTEFQEKGNGQIVEYTTLNSDKSTEKITINNKDYDLKSCEFIKSGIIDKKPAIDYLTGNIWQKTVYSITDADGNDAGTISLDVLADYYGYNNFWGSAETYSYKYLINNEETKGNKTDNWGGYAKINVSNSLENNLIYIENQPEVISFSGGFINKQSRTNVLEYTSELPEFDFEGNSTDNILKTSGNTKIESFPVSKRLLAYSIPSIKGHWAEMDILKLFGIEVFKSTRENFQPEKYTNRAEFIYRFYNALGDIPKDPLIKIKNSPTTQKVTSPFVDVPDNHPYINEITGAYNKKIIIGTGDGKFLPESNLKFVDAIVIMIKSLGLEKTVTSLKVRTTFKDDNIIPAYARNSVYVAQNIGLILGDSRGYLKPNETLTNARSSAIITRFMDYMSNGIKKDYTDGILNY